MTMVGTHPTTLVTGGCGFIGFALSRRLISAGHQVVVYDDLSRGAAASLPDGATLVEGDIRDAATFGRALAESGAESVIHLAALHYLPDCAARPRETFDVNVEGTRRVLDACRTGGVRRFVFASTAAVYAPVESPCVEDVTPMGPIEVYGESKLEGERLVETFARETGLAATSVRLFNAVGRRETNPHVIPHIFESLRHANHVWLGNLEPRRDYIDTRDIADALVGLLESSKGHRVFNVGTGEAHSVADIIAKLQRILGRHVEVQQDPARLRPVERRVLVADINRIRAATSWAPRVTLDASLRDLAAAYGLDTDDAPRPRNANPTTTPQP